MIYLASASPRRHEILDSMGVAHEVLEVPAPEGDDEPRLPGESPLRYVERTACEKGLRAWAFIMERGLAPRPVLSADTTVSLGDEIFGKPADAADAARMLARLSGTTHMVRTCVVLVHKGRTSVETSSTEVTLAALSPEEIGAYCDSGEPFGKAGAYAIQGRAGRFIPRISGSYTGVVGLPVFETWRLLARLAPSSGAQR